MVLEIFAVFSGCSCFSLGPVVLYIVFVVFPLPQTLVKTLTTYARMEVVGKIFKFIFLRRFGSTFCGFPAV